LHHARPLREHVNQGLLNEGLYLEWVSDAHAHWDLFFILGQNWTKWLEVHRTNHDYSYQEIMAESV
jgi:hypothetical protein